MNNIFLPSAFYAMIMSEDREMECAAYVYGYAVLNVLTRVVLSESGQLKQQHTGS